MAKLNLGAVTAYADAVKAGFTGTREEFAEWLANAAKNAQAVADNLEESKKVLADVNTAGETQVGAVQDEGTAQIGNVGKAGDAQIERIAAMDAVSFDTAQSKTDAQKETARKNIDAASREEVDKISEEKVDKESIVQTTGDSKTAVMSQKAASNNFANALKNTVQRSAVTIDDVATTDKVRVSFKNKNLLNHKLFTPSTRNGVTLTIADDGRFILNGTATDGFSFYAFFSKKINDTLSTSIIEVSGTTSALVSLSVDNVENSWCCAYIKSDGSVTNCTTNIGEIKGFYIWIDSGTVFNNLSFKWQVEQNFVPTSYKPPIDENSSVIVTSYGKNLLNHKLFTPSTRNGVTLTIADDGRFILNGTATDGFSFGVSANQKINTNLMVSVEVLSGATSKVIYPSLTDSNGKTNTANIYPSGECGKYTGYFDSINTIYIWIDKGTVFDYLNFTWQIEVGTTKTAHEKYIDGETISTTIANGAEVSPIYPYMTILSDIKDLVICAEYTKDTASVDEQKNVFAYNLPALCLYGDTNAMSKDNAVDMTYKYGKLKGNCTVKWQGSSSLYYPKKNYTIKFGNGFEAKAGWGVQKKYCAKANWIDATHARNVVSAILWGQIVKSRTTANAALNPLPNAGAIDGFPIIITINDSFDGLFTFNIPKDGWMFGMGSGTSEAILCADNRDNGATNFAGTALCDGTDFELEYVSDEDDADWVATSVNRMIDACRNSDGTDLDTIGQYLDWDSVIDYYIFTCLIKGIDITDKNYLLSTYDGVKWFFSAYDLDSTWGLQTDGSEILPSNSGVSFQYYTGHRAMKLVYTYKRTELISRYKELRNGVLSEDNVATVFANFIGLIPEEVFSAERQRWGKVPLTSVNNLHQITDWYSRRTAVLDTEIESLQ